MRLSGALVAQLVILLATSAAIADAQTEPADTTTQPATSSVAPAVPTTAPEAGPSPREPGAADTDEPIHLHMPTAPPAAQRQQVEQKPVVLHAARHKKHRAIAKVESSEHAAGVEPVEAPSAAKAQAVSKAPPNKVANVPAANPNSDGGASPVDAFATAVPFSFVPNSASSPPPVKLPPVKPGTLPPVIAKASPPPATNLPPDVSLNPGLVRQSQILFAPGAPNPSVDALDAIRGLAGPLNTALAAGASHIEVIAYGGSRGDHSSDARRLSLKRALAIRQLLIEGGVPASRIDVRAMGGANDSAAADRVDVFTKA
jgi:outer membrane protein OmpA-like peptidoglycan-associated protein